MSGARREIRRTLAALPRHPSSVVHFLRQRVRERQFWVVQAGVLGITLVHGVVEAATEAAVDHGTLGTTLHHIPVLLYLVPVTYAGLIYGVEGGVFTGLWSAALTTPNLGLWHLQGYEWVGETLFVVAVIGMGTVTALLVERERRARERAERTARRLTTVNEVATMSGHLGDLDATVRPALARLAGLAGLRAVAIELGEPGGKARVSVATTPEGGAAPPLPDAGDGARADSTLMRFDLASENLTGTLSALVPQGGTLSEEDTELLSAVGNQLGVAIENVLLHRQEREWLESYVQRVTEAQEQERKRIARELHDGAAQQLAVLCQRLDNSGTGGGNGTRLDELRELAEATLQDLRRFGRDLRPAVLDDLGLVPALEWLVTDVRERSDIHTDFRVEGETRRVDSGTEVALFRIAQEALRNAERHAGAANVVVEMAFESDGELRLRVQDDGAGFEAPANATSLVPSGRLGIMGMHERAQLVGGILSVRSSPRQGTEVLVTVGS